jgi:branched-chain amino acid transport system ATP-binding protein
MRIEVEKLTKRYRDADRELTVIDNLSFSFPDRGSVAIIGRSGTGKSTLMHLLGALDSPSFGCVRYGDTNISSLRSDERAAFRAKNIGFIFQFHHLLPEFTALENVALPLIMSGMSEGEAQERSGALLDKVGLASRKEHLPSQLSGGEQQMLTLCRTLMGDPDLIMIDEPTEGLAPKIVDLVAEYLKALKDRGISILLVEQKLAIALEISQRVYVMGHGMIVFEGTPDALRANQAIRKEWLEV